VNTVPEQFEPLTVLKSLVDQGVKFVLIGGLAARYLGSAVITRDVDICYARDHPNLQALASVLRELEATLRGAPKELPFILDAETLRNGDHFTFTTPYGSVDILGTPAGTKGYDELLRNAMVLELGDVRVHVAGVEDLIRMKRAAGREKDLGHIVNLLALRDEIEGMPG